MVQPLHHLDLALEALAEDGEVLLDSLDGDESVALQVPALVDDRHAALAQHVEQEELIEPQASPQGIRRIAFRPAEELFALIAGQGGGEALGRSSPGGLLA